MGTNSFFSHHSAFGAYSTFTMGKVDRGGGFKLSHVFPSHNNLYIGFKKDGEKGKIFPFVETKQQEKKESAFTSINELEAGEAATSVFIGKNDFQREMNWATETWSHENFRFSLLTPFTYSDELKNLDEDSIKKLVLPAIFAELEYDNTNSEKEAMIVFGMEDMTRLISDTLGGGYAGGAKDTRTAFACLTDGKAVSEQFGWEMLNNLWEDRVLNRLGNEVATRITVAPGKKEKVTFVLATYQSGVITSGIPTSFLYTKYFKDIEEVITFALENKEYYLKTVKERDEELQNGSLNEHQQFLISHATRSYYANTQLLVDEGGEPIWVVNEGEYQMMNTFDLTIDQLFFEMKFHPWTSKYVLDLFNKRYSYFDKVHNRAGEEFPGGLSFTHDMGVANMFSSEGYSSYERAKLDGCFSYMTHEQLVNWTLCSTIYGLNADKQWLMEQTDSFRQVFQSLLNRDLNDDGIMDVDSSRCEGGSEITTYDSLDESLGQARNNLYLAVKTWASYVSLEHVFKALNLPERADEAVRKSYQIVETLKKQFDHENEFIPAVFEQNNRSKIIPAVEGLLFPYYLGDKDAVSKDGRYKELIALLSKHIRTVLKEDVCIDKQSGAWKLSSTSYNTWMSKIFMSQFVIKDILELEYEEQLWENWDKVHADFMKNACSELAATDQVDSRNGKDLGSRLYPRLVTNILWVKNGV
ncbi:Glycosyl hydrolase family 52 [Evansella caseinilytica]|uniref:Glycosyl hydrolase family 52 n=1 Tax=Evansella caseinilytica TaxID=1503961 RepID=A0A1H3TEG9_9BACI|nr:glycoside hydrolase family 52 protein [Evansella caseinilytica]SDZ48662.1 Glycosyl hydrolase family 52 [Evansella caseinilytica]